MSIDPSVVEQRLNAIRHLHDRHNNEVQQQHDPAVDHEEDDGGHVHFQGPPAHFKFGRGGYRGRFKKQFAPRGRRKGPAGMHGD